MSITKLFAVIMTFVYICVLLISNDHVYPFALSHLVPFLRQNHEVGGRRGPYPHSCDLLSLPEQQLRLQLFKWQCNVTK